MGKNTDVWTGHKRCARDGAVDGCSSLKVLLGIKYQSLLPRDGRMTTTVYVILIIVINQGSSCHNRLCYADPFGFLRQAMNEYPHFIGFKNT